MTETENTNKAEKATETTTRSMTPTTIEIHEKRTLGEIGISESDGSTAIMDQIECWVPVANANDDGDPFKNVDEAERYAEAHSEAGTRVYRVVRARPAFTVETQQVEKRIRKPAP